MPESFAHLRVGAVTDVGVKRKNNEDSIITLPNHGVFCVADGMGGAQGGEIASQAAVSSLERAFGALSSPEAIASANGKAHVIDVALNQASTWIKDRAEKKGIKGSGTTAVVIAFDGRDPTRAMVVHAGDSRAYRYREGKLVQLSRDHTVAEAAGIKDDKELPSMFKGVVTRAVGVNRQVELERTPTDVAPGDVYLLASDGLDKLIEDEEIEQFIRDHYDPDRMQELAQKLVDTTNARGGVDNVSVILIWVGEADPGSLTPGDEADDRLSTERITGGFGLSEAHERGTDDTTVPTGDYIGTSPLRPSPTGDRPPSSQGVAASVAPARKPMPFFNRLPLLVGAALSALILVSWWFNRTRDSEVATVEDWNENELETFTGPGERYGPPSRPLVPAGDPEEMLERLAAEISGEATEPSVDAASPAGSDLGAASAAPSPTAEPPSPSAGPSDIAAPPPAAEAPSPTGAGGEAPAGETTGAQADAAGAALPVPADGDAPPVTVQPRDDPAVVAKRLAENRTAFDQTVEGLKARVPGSIADPEGLAAAEQLARALKDFEARAWSDIDPGEVREQAAMIRAVLAKQAELRVRDLRDEAVAALRAEDEDLEAARRLLALGEQAPALSALAGEPYREAADVVGDLLDQRDAAFGFQQAAARIRGKLRVTEDLNADGVSLEQAAVALDALTIRDWVALPAELRKETLASLRRGIQDAAEAYLQRVAERAVAAVDAKDEQDPAVAILDGFEAAFPAVAELCGRELKTARMAVQRVRTVQADHQRFADALREVRDGFPDPFTSPEQVPEAERSAALWADYRERAWRSVDEERQEKAFGELREHLRTRTLGYLQRLHDDAMARYRRGEDGGAAVEDIRSFADQAPTLRSLLAIEYDRLTDPVERAWALFTRNRAFESARDPVMDAMPATIDTEQDVRRAEEAWQAYLQLAGQAWDDVPAASDEMARIQALFQERGQTYLDRLAARGESAARQGGDVDAELQRLDDLSRVAPGLSVLWQPGLSDARGRLEEAGRQRMERERVAQTERRAAALERLRETLPGQVDEAASTGRWGALAGHLASLGPEADQMLEESGVAERYRGWLKVWEQAASDADASQTIVLRIHRSVAKLCADVGAPAPADVSFGFGDPDEEASSVCAARHALQDHLLAEMDKARKRYETDMGTNADSLEPALRQLGSFAKAEDPEVVLRVTGMHAGVQRRVDALGAWLSGLPPGPIPPARLEELDALGLGEVPRLLDAVWAEVYGLVNPGLLDTLYYAVLYEHFHGRKFDQVEGLEDAVRELEGAAYEFVESRKPFMEEGVENDARPWRTQVGANLLNAVLSGVRDVAALLPAEQR